MDLGTQTEGRGTSRRHNSTNTPGLTHGTRVRAALSLALLTALSAATAAQNARPGMTVKDGAGSPDEWDTFSVDIAVSRSHVGKDGKPKKPAGSPTTYRWQRNQTANGWKTSITTVAQVKPVVKALDGVRELELADDLGPVRIEDDEDGSPVRFYDARGRQIDVPSRADLKRRGLPELTLARPAMSADAPPRRRTTGRDWLDTFVVHKGKKDKRRKGLENKFGRARGQVRGLDRFLTPSADGEDEVLVDQEFSVPVEMNRVRKGALVSHTTLGYERTAGDALVRRSMRTEQIIDDGEDAGDRLVADVQFANLRIERKEGSR